MPQPHDAFFKRVFCRPELAADLLRRRLPASALAELDLDHLERLDGEFIDDTLRNRRADLVFRVPVREARGRSALVQCLMEHRSTPARLTVFKVMGYAMHLLDRHVTRHRAQHGRAPTSLPVIIPLVVYQSDRPWTGPRDLVELFDMPPALDPALGPHLPRFRLLIDDLSGDDPPENPARYALTDAVLLTMRYVRNEADPEGFKRRWRALLDAAKDDPHKIQVVEANTRYLYDVADRLDVRDIVETAQAVLDTETRETMMTLTEKLKEMGREEGLKRGIEQGIEQGIRRGRAEGVLNLLRLKFGPPDAETTQRVHAAEIDTLDRWSGRILTARTLAEVFDDPA